MADSEDNSCGKEPCKAHCHLRDADEAVMIVYER